MDLRVIEKMDLRVIESGMVGSFSLGPNPGVHEPELTLAVLT
jgi:hypothetical protein